VPLELNDSFVNKNLNSYSIVWVKIWQSNYSMLL
jgi:hypothetical protein